MCYHWTMASLVKKVISGRPYYYLIWNARVDGKPRRVRQVYLGTAEDVAARLAAQEGDPGSEAAYSICREFGASAAVWAVIQKVGFIDIVDSVVPQGKSELSVGEYMALAAINRCVDPRSKRGMADWYASTCLSEMLPASAKSLTTQRFWDAMDALSEEHIQAIEERLVRRVYEVFDLDVRHVIYDATNFFTFIDTQTDSVLAQRGHNKAHRDDLRQVSVGLLVSLDFGVPLFHCTYAGNVADSVEFAALLDPMVKRVRQLNASAEITLVFDKGNNSEENFKKLDALLGVHYVGSLPPSQHTDLLDVPLSRFSEVKGKRLEGVKAYRTTKKVFGKTRTVIVTWNPRLAAGQLGALMSYLKKKATALNEISERLQKLPGRPPGQQKRTTIKTVQRQVDELLKRKEVKQCFQVNVKERGGLPTLSFEMNAQAVANLQEHLYGRNVLVTDHADWSTEDIVLAYRSQYKLEHQFRNMKDPRGLCWWPRFHWTDQKIRVHAFYCIVGLLLVTLIQRELAKTGLDIPIPRMLKQLRAIQESTLVTGLPTGPRTTTTLTKMNDDQKHTFEALSLGRLTARNDLGTTKSKRRTRHRQTV